MTEMYHKVNGCKVKVYHFYEDGSVLIYNPAIAGKQNGNGWQKCKLKNLIPMEYFDEEATNGFQSKSLKNKIKDRLTLKSAIWVATDGTEFNDCDEAIKYEKEVMNYDK